MGTDNLILRTVYLSPEVDDKLRVQAFFQRTSKNDLIRKYIDLGMKAANVSQTVASPDKTGALPGSIVSRENTAVKQVRKRNTARPAAKRAAGA